VYGSAEVESRITALVAEAARAVEQAISPDTYRALVLIGGYGRGEGGVEWRGGQEYPHNNLDFLLILKDEAATKQIAMKEMLDQILNRLGQRHGIGMDLGMITTGRLKNAPGLVMWHDMRFGHKTLLGDATFVPSLTQFSPERIDPADIRNLLVNRGTLLLINQMLLDKGTLSADESRTIVRHAMKAIIGYGDALLFAYGAYHWSYAEKQRRMAARQEIPEAFRALYNQAIEFRFRPDYTPYQATDLAAWVRNLIAVLEPVHLTCEAKRLQAPTLTWEGYSNLAFRHTLHEDLGSPRSLARKTLRMLQSLPALPHADLVTQLGYRCGGWRGALPVLFPVIAYDLPQPEFRKRARLLLEAENDSLPALRRAYLRSWASYGDTNFHTVIKKLGLSLDAAPSVEVAR
jgi:hypothetical protein